MHFEKIHLYIILVAAAIMAGLSVIYNGNKEGFDQKLEDTKENIRQTINELYLKYIFGRTIGTRPQ